MKPLRLSWSQLRVHDECHQKSFLLRTGKRSKITDLRNYFHGMVVDRAMRDWLNDPHRSSGDMITMVTDLMQTVEDDARATGDGIVRWRDSQDRTELGLFCVELVRRLEPILDRIVLPYDYQAATRFSVPISIPDLDGNQRQITLVGETDLTVRTPTGLQVWDLKGTKDNSYWRKVLGQLYFYDLAMLAATGQRTECVGLIQPMCDEPVITLRVTDDDRASIYARIERLAHDIWADERSCKATTTGCSWCEVAHACSRFAPDDDVMGLSSALRRAATTQGPA